MAEQRQGMADPSTRGKLEIADKVIDRIATLAASEVAGVMTSGSALEGVIGRRLPKADAEVAGGHARVDVQVAIAWPHPLATVTAQVRDTVRRRLLELAGLAVDAVNVTAVKVVHPDATPERRVL